MLFEIYIYRERECACLYVCMYVWYSVEADYNEGLYVKSIKLH